ncbi:MAG: PAS domain-containing protein [Verrucomicrobia bacterium]|nr:PAS domain-containing protein [Cytophagales bacterium]
MNKFLQWFQGNFIGAGLIAILVLVTVNLIFNTYNKNIITRSQEVLKKTETTKSQTQKIISETVHRLDLGVRGFALTKDEKLLEPFTLAIASNDSVFMILENELKSQKYNAVHLADLKKEVANYIILCKEMVNAARNDSMQQFTAMLKEDRGYGVWTKYLDFQTPLFTYEEELNRSAKADYEQALASSNWLTWLLWLISVPTIGLVWQRTAKANTERRKLLQSLEENNNKYLFDDGTVTEVQISDAKVIIGRTIANLKQASEFVKDISSGNYDVQWQGINANNQALNQTNLAGELLQMREQMKKMKTEDEKRFWINEGLAQFSQLVRNFQHDLEQLTYEANRFLTKYLKAQQGSLFVLQNSHEQEPYLELVACYAFDKKKFIEKRIDIGSGIVGQTFLEGKPTLLTKLPQGYTSITSGLGNATPGCLAVMPMKFNDKTEAILELASFEKFEAYQLDFLEKAGEFVASAILAAKTNEKMTQLLEQAQQQSEIMQAQEEEMRQNMEEMQATQEEMQRKNRETEIVISQLQQKEQKLEESSLWLQTIIDNLPKGIFWKESKNLSFLGANKIFAGLTGFTSKTIVGKTDFDCPWKKEESEMFREDDQQVINSRKAKIDIEEQNTNASGETQWLSTTKVPIADAKGEIVAVLGMFEDITQRKKRESEYADKMKENALLKAENKQLLEKLQTYH